MNEKKIIEIQVDITEALTRIDILAKSLDTLDDRNSKLAKQTKAEMSVIAKALADEEKLRQQKIKTLIQEEKLEMQKMKTTQQSNKQVKVKEGYINELREQVKQLEMAYFALTKAELDSAKGAETLKALKDKRIELSKLQQAYGNHTLNVGNYSSATKMLGINLGQVMKEMPNFAISARIGIMSLTNNLPMLAESIKMVQLEQIAAKKAQEGMTAAQIAALGPMAKIPSMFSLITKSIFGLTGIMSILMVLLQLFGGDIIKWIGNLFKAEEAVDGLTKKMYDLKTVSEISHDAMKDGGGVYKQAVDSINRHKAALENSKGSTILAQKAVDEYNESLGKTFGKANDVATALKNIKDSEKVYLEAMKNMALANAFFDYSAEASIKVMEVKLKANAVVLGDTSKEYIKNIEKAQKRLKDGASEWVSAYDIAGNKIMKRVQIPENRLRTEFNIAVREYNEAAAEQREKQISEIDKTQRAALNAANSYYAKWAEMVKKHNLFTTETEKESGLREFDFHVKILDAKARANEEDLKREVDILNANYEKKKQEARDYIIYLEQQAKKGNKQAKAELTQAREDEKALQIALTEAQTEEEFRIIEKYIDKRKKLQDDFIKSSISAFERSLAEDERLGDDSVKDQLRIWKAKRDNEYNALQDKLAINEESLTEQFKIEKELREFNMVEELAAAYITEDQKQLIRDKYRKLDKDAEEKLIQDKMNIYMAYAQGAMNVASGIHSFVSQVEQNQLAAYAQSIAGRANYDELYAKKKLELQIKAAKREKALGIFGAIIDTAASIMRIWADKIPTATKIPLSIMAGVVGAAQIATIAATPLPSADISTGTKISSAPTTTVTEKFHTGKDRYSTEPNSKLKSDEIYSILQKTETVLDPRSASVFDSIIGRMRSMGGSEQITQGVGVSSILQEKMIERAFGKALEKMPNPVMSWAEFENQAVRQNRLRNNSIVR